jgi:hypothetical protein
VVQSEGTSTKTKTVRRNIEMYKFNVAVKRGSALLGAVGLLVGIGASALPAFVSADTLNPLTKRSLSLSSSSPGWAYTDGSGNTLYAPPNSGANGQKTGNSFAFHNSTASGALNAMTFQYCTTSAGLCTSPGDDTGDPGGSDDSSHADLNVATNNPAELASSDFSTVIDSTTGDVKAVPGVTDPLTTAGHPITTGQYAAHAVPGNFVVYYDNAGTWTQSTGWVMTVANVENGTGTLTGKKNYIYLTMHTGTLSVPVDTAIKVLFFGTTNNYITNPGAGAFFVKINTYHNFTDTTGTPTYTNADTYTVSSTDVVDGGVTVANVMNQSIQITTKVLETMQFSVGTVDPDTLSSADGSSGVQSSYEAAEGLSSVAPGNTHKHGSCDNVLTAPVPADPANVLQLGNQDAESSLETAHTYSTHSYFRLSSNSSAGATIYYSGHTLSNTENDQIAPINGGSGTALTPTHGTAQFGLALDNGANTGSGTTAGTDTKYDVSYAQEATYENAADNSGTPGVDATTTSDNASNASYHLPWLFPLTPNANYGNGVGNIDNSPDTSFAFDENSDTIPAAVATESTSVVDCITGKVRYIANIAATTPAGIYTTKINWIAAPQY